MQIEAVDASFAHADQQLVELCAPVLPRQNSELHRSRSHPALGFAAFRLWTVRIHAAR